ncbi:pitrilysin family protein [Rubrivirga sp. S365]|uniref:M16 family metallopeptidase n=1 Tax=Rubrivirga sp. S365 TaxID=3076080 RepID=UPI0028C85F2B|nr:pitrilysin family protein [Rubrivirga sp. S365]MDT7857893.1 pitrilysin family protein [Rubrivirga sp. S365]
MRLATFAALAVLLAPLAAAQDDPLAGLPDIPYETFVLDNGLTLIVHEDHKAPIVAVNVWYHVGSKDEPDGKSGFAHLFEHLMFNGSENFNDDYFQVLERVGATDLNGTTNPDRTNYFQNVPTEALDAVLFMESDRMGHLLGAVDQAKLDEQRGVVQNEKRQGENNPYGMTRQLVNDATYPEGHPYDHTTIGSMEDLNAASLEDVQEWFRTYYGPNNAVVVVAGDVTPEVALEKVERYFGDIEPGPPVASFERWVAPMDGDRRQITEDRVPAARITRVWNVPEVGSTDANLLSVAASVLASGKTSRLYERLVYRDQIATDVYAYVNTGEIGSQLTIVATAQPGADVAAVEAALDEEMARFLQTGPTQAELDRVQTGIRADFVRGVERIGGFGGKSDVLAESQVYLGSPDAYRADLAEALVATPSQVQDAAQRWMTTGSYTLVTVPRPELSATASAVDRTAGVPEPAGGVPAVTFPDLQRRTLSNGLDVVLAERHDIPLVEMRLIVDAGYAADDPARPGLASLTMDMMDEGAAGLDALEIAEREAALGAEIGTGAAIDVLTVSASALTANLAETLDLMADIALRSDFPAADLERLRQQRLAQIQSEKSQPVGLAIRVLPAKLYGEGHAYGLPLSGSGTEAAVQSFTRDDLAAFHDTWFRPNNATLVVAGDVTMDALVAQLERQFAGWERGDVPAKNVATVEQPEPRVYLLDRPGAQQSIVMAAHLAPGRDDPNDLATETLNTLFGGSFTSRVNMNLREDKGWSYGAQSLLLGARGQRPFLVFAPVQTDKTGESMGEIVRELRDVVGGRPATAAEVAQAKAGQTLTLSGRWETLGALGSSVAEIVQYDLDDDYYQRYAGEITALDTERVARAAQSLVRPDNVVWVVVGDLSEIEAPVRALGLGPVEIIDADGNTVR